MDWIVQFRSDCDDDGETPYWYIVVIDDKTGEPSFWRLYSSRSFKTILAYILPAASVSFVRCALVCVPDRGDSLWQEKQSKYGPMKNGMMELFPNAYLLLLMPEMMRVSLSLFLMIF